MECLRSTYAVRDLRSFQEHLLSGLQKMVPSEVNAYNEVNLRTQHNEVIYDRPETVALRQSEEIFDRYIPEHPVIAYTKNKRGHGPVKLSDFVSQSQFHRLGLYQEFFRPIRIEDQMIMSFPSPRPVVIGIALNRNHRSFTERDRLLLNLAYPHLLQAYKSAEAWTRIAGELSSLKAALEQVHAPVIVLTHAGQVRAITSKAIKLIAKYFSGRLAPHDPLPELVRRWAKQQGTALSDSSTAIREPLVIEREEGRLLIRLFSEQSQSLLLLEEHSAPESRMGFGLTRREAEVLKWVARGKTNNYISAVLGTSPRTVQKHLEHVFEKLGVATRTAAAAKAVWMTEDAGLPG
jgi:DNA-binding NarL/FixJ family response regulator